jgi:hypothetical protein
MTLILSLTHDPKPTVNSIAQIEQQLDERIETEVTDSSPSGGNVEDPVSSSEETSSGSSPSSSSSGEDNEDPSMILTTSANP